MIYKATLQILEADLLLRNYMDSDKCPITRAFKRAGLPFRDAGTEVVHQETGARFSTLKIPGYNAFNLKVEMMSIGGVTPKDFTFEFKLDTRKF